MSRTDKDAPDWVRAHHDPHARFRHAWRCEHTYYGLHHPDQALRCDLADTTNIRTNRCIYWAADRTRWYTGAGPGRRMLHLEYFGPERASVRDTLRAALREYNADGCTDTEPEPRQTRSSPWCGGYWD